MANEIFVIGLWFQASYKLYTSQYGTELYLKQNMSIKLRNAYAKFRCGAVKNRTI